MDLMHELGKARREIEYLKTSLTAAQQAPVCVCFLSLSLSLSLSLHGDNLWDLLNTNRLCVSVRVGLGSRWT